MSDRPAPTEASSRPGPSSNPPPKGWLATHPKEATLTVVVATVTLLCTAMFNHCAGLDDIKLNIASLKTQIAEEHGELRGEHKELAAESKRLDLKLDHLGKDVYEHHRHGFVGTPTQLRACSATPPSQ